MRTFDDFTLGEELPLGNASFAQDEMIAFAQRWDPQPFHVDPEAAAQTHYGEIIASGWQTLTSVSRLMTDLILEQDWANLGGTGMDEVRLRAPVRSGDVLSAKATVIAMEPSRSSQARGRIDFRVEFTYQRGERVGDYVVSLLLARRDDG